jgi:uncharacterized membrane protein YkvA (DUF1232 family)
VKLLRTIAAVRHELPRVVPLFRDARVPPWAKILAVLAAVIIVSPLDLLGDIPFLGFFDDGALLLFVVHLFVTFAQKRTYIDTQPVVTIIA